MKARAVIGADYLAPLQRVDRQRRTTPSILLDDALAAGSLEATAQTIGLAGRGEWPDHRAVEDTLGSEIGAPNGRLLTIEQMRILRLQRADRGLRFGVALLRRNLHDIAARCGAAGRGRVQACRRRYRGNTIPWRGGTLAGGRL